LAIMADPTPQHVQSLIAAGMACEHLLVEGDGRHFFASIVSTQFEGLSRIRRHQAVYAVLGERMREEIHALSMKTLTPAEHAVQAAQTATPSGAGATHPSH
jgi:acid stress-induced BolA-like protein IbaG/YrbA